MFRFENVCLPGDVKFSTAGQSTHYTGKTLFACTHRTLAVYFVEHEEKKRYGCICTQQELVVFIVHILKNYHAKGGYAEGGGLTSSHM